MISIDYILDENGDLWEDETTGDWVEGDCDAQHIEDCLITEPGILAHNILAGVGLTKQINGTIDGRVRRDIQLQLLADNYRVERLNIDNENIDINAVREG